MEGIRAPPSEPIDGGDGGLLQEEDVVAALARGQAVQKDVQESLTRLASALSSASDHGGILRTVKRCFEERTEACENLARVTEEARAEKESSAQLSQAQSEREAFLRHEIDRLERAVSTVEEEGKKAQHEAELASRKAGQEIKRLQEKTANAETDAAEWQRKANSGEARLESMAEEVGALHEAMAGLHGEMGAVQRELDGAKASQEKLAADLDRAEGRHRKSQEASASHLARAKDAEKRLREESEQRERLSAKFIKLQEISEQGMAERSALSAEAKRLKESDGVHRSSSDKLNATNRELNALLQRLSADLEDAKSASEASSKRADASAAEAKLREEDGRRAKEALVSTESRLAAAEREQNFLKEALEKASAEAHAKTAELDRQRGERKIFSKEMKALDKDQACLKKSQLDLLEREKHDLIMDMQERVRLHQEAMADAELHKKCVEEAEKRLKDAESTKLAAESSMTKALDELGDARRGTAMQDERIEALRSEITTLRRSLEQTTEAAKSRDKESAQRLVQLSQANAKLSSEGASARARVADAEEAAEKAGHELEDAMQKLAKSQEVGRRASESVQRLEEELEVADAKWKAAQGQLANATQRETRFAEEARQQLRSALEAKDKEVETVVREAQINAQRRSMEAEASRRAVERNLERTLAAVREEATKKLAAEEARRLREVSDARRKSQAVVEALQTLQGELRNSEAKGSGLERQVSQLSARMNRTSSSSVAAAAGGGGAGSDGGSVTSNSGAGREGGESVASMGRGVEVFEAELASLRRQMKAATQAKEMAQRSALEARSSAEEETKRRSSLEASLCRKESELLAALERVNVLKIRQQETEASYREAEEDLRGLVRQRESEIESLTRRNQVLNEALSRLTSSDPHPIHIGATSNLSAISTASAGGADGFPAIPRLMDRGRELAASLGDRWQPASASSFSPTSAGVEGISFSGLEAPLSVLADGSAGFEPPAPPSLGTSHGHRLEHGSSDSAATHLRLGSDATVCSSQRYHSEKVRSAEDGNRDGLDEGPATGAGRGDGKSGGREEGRGRNEEKNSFRHQGTAITSWHGDHYPDNGDRPAAAAETGHEIVGANGTNGRGGKGVLRGMSAAMASGALQMAARSTPNAPSAVQQDHLVVGSANPQSSNDGPDKISDHLPRVGERKDGRAGGRQLGNQGLHEASSARVDAQGGSRVADDKAGGDEDPGTGGDGQALQGTWRLDDRDEAARQKIDQALRERALRRRNSDGEKLVLPHRQDSLRRMTSISNNSTTTAANLSFPAPVRSEFRTSASSDSILGDTGEGATFINLGAIAARRGGRSSKRGLPGRAGGGGRVAVRSAAADASNVVPGAAAGKKYSADLAYRRPQSNR